MDAHIHCSARLLLHTAALYGPNVPVQRFSVLSSGPAGTCQCTFTPLQLCFTPNCRRSKLSYDDNTAQGHESAWLRSHRSTSSLLGRSLDAHGEKSCKTQGRHCSARLLPVCCASMAAHLGVPLKTSRNTRSSTEDYRKDESQKVLAEQHPV